VVEPGEAGEHQEAADAGLECHVEARVELVVGRVEAGQIDRLATGLLIGPSYGGRTGLDALAEGRELLVEVAENFYDSEPVQTTLELAKAADAVMVAIGITGAESLLAGAGYVAKRDMARVIKAGAIGEVFGRYFDVAGHPVMPEATHPISLTLEDLRDSRRVIAAVGGADKVEAVRGAIASGIIDELATDDTLARALLA